jgi:Na+/H+-dicarboxylate symporter
MWWSSQIDPKGKSQVPEQVFAWFGLLFSIPLLVAGAMAIGHAELAPLIVLAILVGGAVVLNTVGSSLMFARAVSTPELRQPDVVARLLERVSMAYGGAVFVIAVVTGWNWLVPVFMGCIYFACACILFGWGWLLYQWLKRRATKAAR